VILIVLKIQIRPDRRDVWLERIAGYTKAVRGEPGSVSFDCYESVDAPGEFAIVEGFASKAAGDAHVQTDHFKDFLVWFPTVIGTAPMIINTEVPGEGFARMNEFG
jgi:quinol monooxygenase YgiN